MEDEPGALEGVAGIEGAAVEVVEEAAVWGYGLEECAEVFFEKEPLDLEDEAVHPLGGAAPGDFDVAEIGTQLLGGGDADHGGADGEHGARLGVDLRQAAAGLEGALQEGGEVTHRCLVVMVVPRGARVGGVADGGEGLAVGVAPHAKGQALAREGEKELPVGGVGVAVEEGDAGAGGIEPRAMGLDAVEEGGEHPGGAALEPDAFVGIEQGAISVQAGEDAFVLLIHAMAQPEGDDVFDELGAVKGGELGAAGGICKAGAGDHARH